MLAAVYTEPRPFESGNEAIKHLPVGAAADLRGVGRTRAANTINVVDSYAPAVV